MKFHYFTTAAGAISAFVLAVVISGCSSGPNMNKVYGTLTHKGKPIPKMQIHFFPVDADKNPASSAITDENGKFEMKVGSTQGVATGEYIIYVQDPIAVMGGTTSEDEAYQAVLKKYGSKEKSTKKITVEQYMGDFKLELD